MSHDANTQISTTAATSTAKFSKPSTCSQALVMTTSPGVASFGVQLQGQWVPAQTPVQQRVIVPQHANPMFRQITWVTPVLPTREHPVSDVFVTPQYQLGPGPVFFRPNQVPAKSYNIQSKPSTSLAANVTIPVCTQQSSYAQVANMNNHAHPPAHADDATDADSSSNTAVFPIMIPLNATKPPLRHSYLSTSYQTTKPQSNSQTVSASVQETWRSRFGQNGSERIIDTSVPPPSPTVSNREEDEKIILQNPDPGDIHKETNIHKISSKETQDSTEWNVNCPEFIPQPTELAEKLPKGLDPSAKAFSPMIQMKTDSVIDAEGEAENIDAVTQFKLEILKRIQDDKALKKTERVNETKSSPSEEIRNGIHKNNNNVSVDHNVCTDGKKSSSHCNLEKYQQKEKMLLHINANSTKHNNNETSGNQRLTQENEKSYSLVNPSFEKTKNDISDTKVIPNSNTKKKINSECNSVQNGGDSLNQNILNLSPAKSPMNKNRPIGNVRNGELHSQDEGHEFDAREDKVCKAILEVIEKKSPKKRNKQQEVDGLLGKVKKSPAKMRDRQPINLASLMNAAMSQQKQLPCMSQLESGRLSPRDLTNQNSQPPASFSGSREMTNQNSQQPASSPSSGREVTSQNSQQPASLSGRRAPVSPQRHLMNEKTPPQSPGWFYIFFVLYLK